MQQDLPGADMAFPGKLASLAPPGSADNCGQAKFPQIPAEGGKKGERKTGWVRRKICFWARTKQSRNSSWDSFPQWTDTGKPV